ncbi:hypothetical protein KAFR_0I01450 [Kazachstania africana CBS 2517]|uniref:Rab-GAP TBC domain-containing protein n=1 Tax=Kazachstania africana (strain ATCC 22294 / BCRC 22015 / CBS 2517 / CECT 1963 / NBRC 1671 / NRRL Y-8276) TaxID=1071382 RepID=H2AZX6_KAZAF|nr:hypothetical protein KAFR_0I01450 [Kazachstania africana CBS 2517]CCF59926.1 hypothetical protein KAFR_0I01450 [Kazachstania africana CBS 2517]
MYIIFNNSRQFTCSSITFNLAIPPLAVVTYPPMQERKSTSVLNSHHLKSLKQREYYKNLVDTVIELININDHDSLAYLARTVGIPPQLRHLVWPLLLKYHPMCISPNIISNIVSFDSSSNNYIIIDNQNISEKTKKNVNLNNIHQQNNNDENINLEKLISNDLKKYFHSRTQHSNVIVKDKKIVSSSTPFSSATNSSPMISSSSSSSSIYSSSSSSSSSSSTSISAASKDYGSTNIINNLIPPNNPTVADELEIVELLKSSILNFLKKWGKIFKYESGLTWIALGLAEWLSPLQTFNNDSLGPIVLSGKRHSPPKNNSAKTSHDDNDTATALNASITTANTSDDSSKFNASNSLSYLYKEYPLPKEIQSKLDIKNLKFFKFEELLERLYLVLLHQPDIELAQSQIIKNFPTVTRKNFNNYYFPILSGGDLSFKFQVFFKIFQSTLPELYQPLNEESSLQPHSPKTSWLYWWIKCCGSRSLHKQDRGRIWDILLGWRPESTDGMNSINFFLNYNANYKNFNHLYNNIDPPGLALLVKNGLLHKLNDNDPFWFPDLDSVPLGSKEFSSDFNVLKELLARNKYDTKMDTNGNSHYNLTSKDEFKLPSSLIDPHIQIIFIYISILQYSEFKLLEFEEAEILEFLNNLPMLSKFDDLNYKGLYNSDKNSKSRSNSTSHMLIELGNDAKASNSFNNLLNIAGDIWRKWLWEELEETLNTEAD